MKECIQQELQKVFDIEVSCDCLKRVTKWLALYGILMLLTFGATLMTPLFGVLLVVELSLISTVLGFIACLCLVYYGVYFARKAWQRVEPEHKKIQTSDYKAD